MNDSVKGSYMAVGIVIAIVLVIVSVQLTEKYRSPQSDYRYGFVDTNPVRRTGQFFDACSPENMEDCSRNNTHEGLPLP